MEFDASFACPACGEKVVIKLDQENDEWLIDIEATSVERDFEDVEVGVERDISESENFEEEEEDVEEAEDEEESESGVEPIEEMDEEEKKVSDGESQPY